MINVKTYTESDKKRWDDYVVRHPEGTLFHLINWKDVIEQTFGHKSLYLLAINPKNPTNPIVGILPLFRIKSLLFGNYLVSMPFAEIGGVLANDHNVEKRLLAQAIKIAEDMRCDYLELRNRKPIENIATKSLYYNFRRQIFSDPHENLMAIPRKARRMIRQGEKFGLVSEFGVHVFPQFYEIMMKSFHNLGTPIFPRKLFINFLKAFKGNAQILLIRTKEKIPIAGVLTFFFKDQVLPYYAGSIFEYRKLAPNDFMYWQLMCDGCERGYKIFDFGRSKVDTGSYHFKRHWGFEPVPLAYQYHLVRAKAMPNLSPANPKYRKKIELWKKLPLPLTEILGPPIARYLA